MNGLEQVAAMSELAKEQPKEWKPDQIGNIRLGDAVRLPSIGCIFEVIGLADPLLVLRAPSGREVKAGWRAVQRVRRKPAA